MIGISFPLSCHWPKAKNAGVGGGAPRNCPFAGRVPLRVCDNDRLLGVPPFRRIKTA